MMAESKVWLVKNRSINTVQVFEKHHQVRKYILDYPHHHLEFQEFTWNYKNQLVLIMNELLKIGGENVSASLD